MFSDVFLKGFMIILVTSSFNHQKQIHTANESYWSKNETKTFGSWIKKEIYLGDRLF